MAYEVPTITLRLKNPQAAKEWDENFKIQLQKHDLISTYMMGCMMATVAIRSAHLKPRIYYYVPVEVVLNFLLYRVQVIDGGRIFAKHRTAIIGLLRTMRTLSIVYLMLVPSQEGLAFPIFSAAQFAWTWPVVFRLLYKSFLPMLQSFGFRATMYHNSWLTLTPVLLLCYFVPPRCSVECTANPSFYTEMYFACMKSLSLLQRLVPGPAKVNVVTNTFILSLLGFIVPTLILAAIEEPSRNFVLMRFGGTPFYHSAKTNLLYTLGLLPIVGALNFELISTATLLFMEESR